MTNLVTLNTIPAMQEDQIERVRYFEDALRKRPQVQIRTTHVLHGGVYYRNVFIPAGVAMAGAYIQIPTTLIISGKCRVFVGNKINYVEGYWIVPASAGRKQAVIADEDTNITMCFPTKAQTIKEAEEEFTNEAEKLFSREEDADNIITITKEQLCLAAYPQLVQ